MSSLKKHTFSPTLAAIALQDFTPNAELFQYDIDTLALTHTADKNPTFPNLPFSASTPQSSGSRLNTYVITHTISLFSKPSNAARQESRMPTPIEQDSGSNSPAFSLEINTQRTQLHPQDFWLLTQHDRTLVKDGVRISLTTLESALIKKMLHHEERVVSKEELIRIIGREPELYRGLEMCLSRLQEKFKRVNDGERLFRAVRNRGYCLTQKIKKPLELTQPRR